ncbi:MAG: GNAT family N-acetyltransferase [Thermoflexibacter sp.]|jgi:putative acetyltransferase|nr:GNAT family N-acetyltransferase [Thermoflexibacter sp.]
MLIRTGHIADLKALQHLFVDTITHVCKADYDNEQIEAWTSGIENLQRWLDILSNQLVLIAEEKGKIIGFCSLHHGNYIDLFYVHKDHQRQGVAYQLYQEIEKEARKLKQTTLVSDVSITARKFFEKMGFEVLKEQSVKVKEVTLTNYKMMKKIN